MIDDDDSDLHRDLLDLPKGRGRGGGYVSPVYDEGFDDEDGLPGFASELSDIDTFLGKKGVIVESPMTLEQGQCYHDLSCC